MHIKNKKINKKRKRVNKKKGKEIEVPMYKYRITDRDVDALVQLNNIENLLKERKAPSYLPLPSPSQLPIKIKKPKPVEEEEELNTSFFITPPRTQNPAFRTGTGREPLRKVTLDPIDAIKEKYKNNPDFSNSTEKPAGENDVMVYNFDSKKKIKAYTRYYKGLLENGWKERYGEHGKEIYPPAK